MPRPALPNWYTWTVLFVFTLGSIAISIVVNANLANRAILADRRARTEAAEQNRQVLCTVVRTQENVFRDATSEVGRNAADAWHDLGILFRCY